MVYPSVHKWFPSDFQVISPWDLYRHFCSLPSGRLRHVRRLRHVSASWLRAGVARAPWWPCPWPSRRSLAPWRQKSSALNTLWISAKRRILWSFISSTTWVISHVPMFHITQPLGINGLLDGYYKVMSNIPKMGHLPNPEQRWWFNEQQWSLHQAKKWLMLPTNMGKTRQKHGDFTNNEWWF